MRVDAVLFDAYGTLFDVHSVVSLAESMYPGNGSALSRAWRAKQLEYSWLRTLSEQYRDFWQVTGDALRWAATSLKLPMHDAEHQRLLDSYLALKPFPENLDVLRELHADGLVLGTLSNGTAAMLDAALESAGMRALLTHVLSVDSVRCYKTGARAYELGRQTLGVPADQSFMLDGQLDGDNI